MSYEALLARMFARRTDGIRFGLDRVRAALARFENPEQTFAVVHIAGTNGKGSVAAMFESIARASGKRTGLFTSPHLNRFTERFRICGLESTREMLAPHLARALDLDIPLTFFEIATLAAFLLFREQAIDIAVLETGLGGRLDATNVVGKPAATVITSIAFDHEALLGHTLAAIAREKAGICKPGVPAILSARDPAILDLLAALAREAGAKPVLRLPGELAPYVGEVPLLGEHQRRNAALAIEAARQALPGISLETIHRALAGTSWPGRMERLERDGGSFLLDVAHNVEAMRTLGAELAQEPMRPRRCVFGVAEDKDAFGMLEILGENIDALVLTRGANDRFREPSEIEVPHLLRGRYRVVRDLKEALGCAASPDGLAVVAGSCFLVGEARSLLYGEPSDAISLSDPPAIKPRPQPFA